VGSPVELPSRNDTVSVCPAPRAAAGAAQDSSAKALNGSKSIVMRVM
jgi:hypothetical protein